ncbi:MAG: bifunctional riboflavin kinase/FAD synthetase [Actinobacteria bacterium]|nr:bifunctional riboflavin kinase/FAD synthetase [Actinomycetota bacterium]MBM3698162.1 bifunctional riboflavin kinase/FAD synthetase [Actinomycetota bacterium]
MKRYQSIGDLPLGEERRVVAIGTFDGVHVGHQAIIGGAVERARERGLQSMVLTFEPNPLAILRPELAPTVLTEPAFKAQLIEALGADALLVVPFTQAFSRIRADRFAEMLGSAPLSAESVVVGANFRFGQGGSGTLAYLQRLGRARGLIVESPGTVMSDDGKPVSSTRVRRLIAQGQVAEVESLLGRPHSVEGMVVPGEQRGREMGLPTANVSVALEVALPARGVYAGRVVLAAGRYPAAINLGYSPTFTEGEDPPLRLEAFILDYEGDDLYGQRIRVEFVERLRDERRFPSPADLVAQVQDDIDRTRALARA